jgi:hypothetical protein
MKGNKMQFAEPEHDAYSQTKEKYTYLFESHLLEIDEKSFIASLVLPADTDVLDVVFDAPTKGIFAYTKHAAADTFVGSMIKTLKFNFVFVGAIFWEVEGDIIDRSEYITTIMIPSGVGIKIASTYHIYLNYETLQEDNEETQAIVKEEEAKEVATV